MPVPLKLPMVVPFAKLVFEPTTATEDNVCPCTPEAGITEFMTGAALTVNHPAKEATSVPVVMVTVRSPKVALEAMVILTVA